MWSGYKANKVTLLVVGQAIPLAMRLLQLE